MTKIIKGFKIRLYPTKEQEIQFKKHIGSCRFIWNYMLNLQKERFQNGEKHLSGFGMMNLLKPLKHIDEYAWLNECSNSSYKIICNDLDNAYKAFFEKRANEPKNKTKKASNQTYPVCVERFYFADCKHVQIEKIGRVKYKTDYTFQTGRNVEKFSNVRITYTNGKWILSFGAECESQTPELTDISMGIDLGVKELATVAFGDEMYVFHNINKSAKMRSLEMRLKHVQRSISRKYEANRINGKYVKTKNIIKEEKKMRRIYAKITNIKKNYLHQTTHSLVALRPRRVVMEDLNISGMLKNRHLSKAISDQKLYEFIRQMRYKCEWNGIEFVQADRFYPSSKTCSCCGSIKRDLKLRDRTYICNECGAVIDRDYNAAINLSRYVA